ncbi:MAG: NrdH-like redox domain-containing protein [marine bacterium B5-7]|nr:MAG: NrdH-like redox domain-containing protein [marine bacterium B5-7]
MKISLVLLLLFYSVVVDAEVYKWIDDTGRVHYSDSTISAEKAERVNLNINSYENVTYERSSASENAPSEKVVMFSTSWCVYCKKAREYFRKNKIDFVDYDIEKDARARKVYKRLGGKGVPVILVGERRMNGFSVSGFERIYQ